jgi:uncharacterized protein YheU (UPF0270 family)
MVRMDLKPDHSPGPHVVLLVKLVVQYTRTVIFHDRKCSSCPMVFARRLPLFTVQAVRANCASFGRQLTFHPSRVFPSNSETKPSSAAANLPGMLRRITTHKPHRAVLFMVCSPFHFHDLRCPRGRSTSSAAHFGLRLERTQLPFRRMLRFSRGLAPYVLPQSPRVTAQSPKAAGGKAPSTPCGNGTPSWSWRAFSRAHAAAHRSWIAPPTELNNVTSSRFTRPGGRPSSTSPNSVQDSAPASKPCRNGHQRRRSAIITAALQRQTSYIEPMHIPHTQLSSAALRAVVQEFVTRDGTDHSSVERRIETVLRQLDAGRIELHFDVETETCNIRPAEETPEAGDCDA